MIEELETMNSNQIIFTAIFFLRCTPWLCHLPTTTTIALRVQLPKPNLSFRVYLVFPNKIVGRGILQRKPHELKDQRND